MISRGNVLRLLSLLLMGLLSASLLAGCGRGEGPVLEQSSETPVAQPQEQQAEEGSAYTMTHSKEELDAIRASLPYQGEPVWYQRNETNVYPIYGDELSVQMADFLTQAVDVGVFPAHSFERPQDAPPDYILQIALKATPPLSNQYGDEQYRLFYIEQLLDLQAYTGGAGHFYTKEHVAETARIIFGSEVPIRHQPLFGYQYAAYTGLYWPDDVIWHNYRSYQPVITARRDLGDRWELEVVYLHSNMHSRWVDLFGAELQADELPAYVQQPWLPRHTITRLKTTGGFIYYGHTLPEPNLTATFAARCQPTATFTGADLLGVLDCGDELPEWSANVYQSEYLTLDQDGDLFYLFPVFEGTSLSIEQLDWTLGNPAVTDTLLYYQPPELDGLPKAAGKDNSGYALALRVNLPPAGEQPAYRIVAARDGKRVEYPLVQDAQAEGVIAIPRQQELAPDAVD